ARDRDAHQRLLGQLARERGPLRRRSEAGARSGTGDRAHDVRERAGRREALPRWQDVLSGDHAARPECEAAGGAVEGAGRPAEAAVAYRRDMRALAWVLIAGVGVGCGKKEQPAAGGGSGSAKPADAAVVDAAAAADAAPVVDAAAASCVPYT